MRFCSAVPIQRLDTKLLSENDPQGKARQGLSDDVGHERCNYTGDYGREDGREEKTGIVCGEVQVAGKISRRKEWSRSLLQEPASSWTTMVGRINDSVWVY